MARYDRIGVGYRRRRQEDPRIAARIWAALGTATSVVNVGAGTGSYEPWDRQVVAVEPSEVMIGQREAHRGPASLGRAEALPLDDLSVDCAMSVLSLHHWDDWRAGLDEMLRVARERIVILTVDPEVSGRMWLMADYLPEVAKRDRRDFPPPALVADHVDGRVEPVPVPADCRDGFLLAFWSHPEWVLDAEARAATSGFALSDPTVVARVVAHVGRDLATGAWDARHGHLRTLDAYDAGLRLITAVRR